MAHIEITPPERNSATVYVRCTPTLKARLNELAQQHGITTNALTVQLLQAALDQIDESRSTHKDRK